MKGNGIRILIIAILIIGVFFFGYWQGSIGFNSVNCNDYNIDTKMLDGATGFYDYSGYYCVWTEGRYYKNIEKTETHEICHHLVNENYNHFCGEER